MQEKHAFVLESFYLQGVFSCMNERDKSSSDCKHKQMLQKTELHLTNLLSCTICYIESSMVLTAGAMFQGCHTHFF